MINFKIFKKVVGLKLNLHCHVTNTYFLKECREMCGRKYNLFILETGICQFLLKKYKLVDACEMIIFAKERSDYLRQRECEIIQITVAFIIINKLMGCISEYPYFPL